MSSTSNMALFLNSYKCFKCNQLGHLAKDCPSTFSFNVGAREGSISSTTHSKNDSNSTTNMTMTPNWYTCFKCFQQGHWAKDCPSSSDFNAGVGEKPISSTTHSENDSNSTTDMTMAPNWDTCFKCFQQGHWAKDCPSSSGFNAGVEERPISSTTYSENDSNSTTNMTMAPTRDTCYKCFQQGHWAKDCPSSSGFNAEAGEGPISSTITSENDSNSTTKMTMAANWDTCFKCFQQGHWANDCPFSNGNDVGGRAAVSSATCEIFKKDVNSTSSFICMPSKSDKCFRCQQPGHWAKDCPSMDSNTRGGPDSSSSFNIPQKICICGRGPCVIRISKTVKNPGRKFYKCPFRECGFFEWCDGQIAPWKDHNPPERFGWQQTSPLKDHNPPERLGGQDFTSPAYTDGGCRRIVKGYDLSTRCPCGAGPCPVNTAKTQKNMGRQFVSCPVRKGEGTCGFFKWCDELDSVASSISSVGNSGLFVTSKQDDSLGRNDT